MGLLDFLQKRSLRQGSPPSLSETADDDLHTGVCHDNDDLGQSEVWSGNYVDHVYRRRDFFDTSCPSCHQRLKPYYVGLIYAAEHGLRQHASPCACICDQCSVALLREDLPRDYANSIGHKYIIPVAVYSLESGPPNPEDLHWFSTYEGKEPIFMLNEEGHLEGLIYKSTRPVKMAGNQCKQKEIKSRKDQRKRQKKSRKQNRHKK